MIKFVKKYNLKIAVLNVLVTNWLNLIKKLL